jgi:hypothetical protein
MVKIFPKFLLQLQPKEKQSFLLDIYCRCTIFSAILFQNLARLLLNNIDPTNQQLHIIATTTLLYI